MSEPNESRHWWVPTTHKLSAASLAGGLTAVVCLIVEYKFKIDVEAAYAAMFTGFFTQFVSWALPDAWEQD